MNLKEIQCKSVLNKSNLPKADYCINPYIGCLHGCIYCYACFMKRFTNHAEQWGDFLDVKINAPEILQKEMTNKQKKGSIILGSVTDAYQPIEKKYEISRKILAILAKYDFPLSVLTKSKLVMRDIDIFRTLKDCEVGLTITSISDRRSSIFEPFASSPMERIETLGTLKSAGIKTYAFIGPILPGITDLEEILSALRKKIDFVMFEALNVNKSNIDKIKKGFVYAGIKDFPLESINWSEIEIRAKKIATQCDIKVRGFYKH